MTNWVYCPNNKSGSRIALAVCLTGCEQKHECKELSEVPWPDIEAVAKKQGIPLNKLQELPRMINVENSGTQDPNADTSDTDEGAGPGTGDGAVAPLPQTDLPAPVEVEIVSTGTTETKRAVALYDKLLVLKREIEARFVEMGDIFNEYYEQKYYLLIGYSSWDQFCGEALGFTTRWVLDIRKIAFKKEQLKLSDLDVAAVGVKKMAQILPVCKDRKSADRWMREARKPGVTVESLLGKVRHALGRSGVHPMNKDLPEEVPVKYILPVYRDNVETVERAFKLAGEVTKSDSRGQQLVALAMEFNGTYENQIDDLDRVRVGLARIRSIERTFNLRVSGDIIDEETGRVVG